MLEAIDFSAQLTRSCQISPLMLQLEATLEQHHKEQRSLILPVRHAYHCNPLGRHRCGFYDQ